VKGREWYQSDDVAATYEDKRFTGGGRLIDDRERAAVQSSLSPVEDRRVLEIACGTGRFSVMLARGGADVVGLDVSSEMLGQAREKAHRAGADAEWVRGDAARLPFPDDAFDAVLAMRFFHLADTPASFLAEMRRVARDQVVFDTFNARSARSIYNWLLPMGSRLYTPGDVHSLIDGAGLDELDPLVVRGRPVEHAEHEPGRGVLAFAGVVVLFIELALDGLEIEPLEVGHTTPVRPAEKKDAGGHRPSERGD